MALTHIQLTEQNAAAPVPGFAGNLFLSAAERQAILGALQAGDEQMLRFFTALKTRVARRTANPGLLGTGTDVQWWYPAMEFVSDAAMLFALAPTGEVATWLADVVMGIVRRSESDWAGPWFRDHSQPYTGHLETAHLCWAVAAALELAADAFTDAEILEVQEALAEKGLTLCRRWLANNAHLANWRGIMASGAIVAAAALRDDEMLAELVAEARLCAQAFQPDGSYGESLQYGNYLAYALMLAYESLCRQYPQRAAQLDVPGYARGLPWIASSMLYAKPLSGWGDAPRARAVNFNDSAAIFRPSGDLLLHVAARCGKDLSKEAGLAKHLFETYYTPVPTQEPHHLASFGFVNDWGFLTLPLLTRTRDIEPLSPAAAALPLTAAFSNGNAFIRDAWDGRTVVGIQGGGDPLHGPGHLHGDLNSFVLVHNEERLLADPGHSCYRNLIHGLESASQTHNTCTFLVEADRLGLQEDLAKSALLEQKSVLGRRLIGEGRPGPPVPRGSRPLITARSGEVSVVGADAAAAYGGPIREFSRFWVAAGPHVLFVVDRIRAASPVTTLWNWLLNNRDGKSFVERLPGGHVRMTRGAAGLQIFHAGDAKPAGPVYGYLHDAYHPEPNRPGEGKPGSGLLYRWTEARPRENRTVVHAFAVDRFALVDGWQFTAGPNRCTLTNGREKWTLAIVEEAPLHFVLESAAGNRWQCREEQPGHFSLQSP
ncbi:MAG: heparinase II/III family protein [Cytophagales bacterium]|nr:heparinase II/III family protein [Cytophagales bacterium]